MKYVAQASKNTSPLPALLVDSNTTDDMKAVLRMVADPENADLARALAKAILSSTTAGEVAAAFAAAAEAAASAGVQDPEELLKIKLDAQVNKFVGSAALSLGDVVSTFMNEAGASGSRDEVLAAYDRAESGARQLLASIES